MSDLRKAAQMALEALEIASRNGSDGLKRYELKELDDTIAELHAALAKPEQLVVGGGDLPTLTKWTPSKPLAGEKLEAMYEDYVTHGDIVRAVEKAHGIGGEE